MENLCQNHALMIQSIDSVLNVLILNYIVILYETLYTQVTSLQPLMVAANVQAFHRGLAGCTGSNGLAVDAKTQIPPLQCT